MTQVDAIYQLQVDLNGDGDFTDTNEDLTAYMRSLDSQVGCNAPYDRMGRSNTLRAVLLNSTHRFSPEHASALANFSRGKVIRARMHYPSNQDGTYSNVTLGRAGITTGEAAALFDGTTSYANIFSSGLASAFSPLAGTISLWLKVSAAGVWSDGVLRRGIALRVDADNIVAITKLVAANSVQVVYRSGAVSSSVIVGTSSVDWLHLMITWNKAADQVKVYANGAQSGATQTGLGTWVGALDTTTTLIGAASTVPANVWSGWLAHAAVWDVVLSATEVANLYAKQATQEEAVHVTQSASLIGYWPLGEQAGSTAENLATSCALYTGRMSVIKPDVFETNNRRTVVQCNGLFSEWQKDSLLLGVMEDVRSDQVVASIINAARIKPVGTIGWRIGVDGFTEIGQTTTVRAGSDKAVLDTGIQSFEIIGDNWANGVSAYAALKSVAEAEWGRVFERPDGKVAFWDRHRLAEDMANAVDGTFSDANTQDMQYQYGENTVSEARVSCRHRVIDTQVTVVAVLDEQVKIRHNRAEEILLPYRNVAGGRIGAKDLVKPIPYQDFIGKKHGNHDFTRSVNIIATPTSSGVKWTVFNNNDQSVYIRAGAQQRGIRITDFGQIQRAAYGGYGSGRFEVNLPVLEDADIAQDLADFIIVERGSDRGMIEAVHFNANTSNEMMLHAVRRAIGDRLTVTETQTGNSQDYFIVGRKDRFANRIHRVTFILEPAQPFNTWLIGVSGFSEIGQTTQVGF